MIISFHRRRLLARKLPCKNRIEAMIGKSRVNKKYRFKQMKIGDTFRLNDSDVRGAQKMAYYYRAICKRPCMVTIIRRDDGYHCQRVA
jgi:hypothetical protein